MNLEHFSDEELDELVNSGKLREVLSEHKEVKPAPVPVIPSIEGQLNTAPVEAPLPRTEVPKPEQQTIIYPDGFDIPDPVELLVLLDDNIARGIVKLHKWQIQFMLDFAAGGVSDKQPFQAVVRACNGSGKDKFVIAACVVWICMKYFRARGVVTSSSGVQLDNQTEAYIRMLCEAANKKFGFLVWKCNYRYYECLATESPILLFATDEAGKAEGYHPLDYGCKMALFESEAKTVPDEIYIAQNKCTGYTHRAIVSTPGPPIGHFYNLCQSAPKRTEIRNILEVNPIDYIQYHVTAYDCSHIPAQYIEQMKRDLPGGESGAAFQSQVMAEFGTTDEMVVIPSIHVWRAVNSVAVGHLPEAQNIGGLDLSAGGDETVLSVRNGNKLLAVIPFRFDNTQDTVRFLEEKFREYKLDHPEAYIYADAGGLGKPIIDQLRSRGWTNIRYVLNQAKAFNDRVYANRGAEMWFNFGKLLETREIWLLQDHKLMGQLSGRYYKILPTNKHQLESKLQARSKGRPSPDRGDSVVLCFSFYKSKLDPEAQPEAPFIAPKEEEPKPVFTIKEWAYQEQEPRWAGVGKSKDMSVYRAFVERHNAEIRAKQKAQINEQIQMQ